MRTNPRGSLRHCHVPPRQGPALLPHQWRCRPRAGRVRSSGRLPWLSTAHRQGLCRRQRRARSSSWTRSEPSSTSTRTAAWSHNPAPGAQRVRQVEVGRVLVAGQHRSDASLRPTCRRLLQLALGEDTDPGAAELGKANRRGQASHTAPDDEDVEPLERAHVHMHQPARRNRKDDPAVMFPPPGCRSGGPARGEPR